MTKEQFDAKWNELQKDLIPYMNELKNRAWSYGAFDKDSYDDDFQLPKIILCAVLNATKDQYMPFTPEGKKEVKNLSYFI